MFMMFALVERLLLVIFFVILFFLRLWVDILEAVGRVRNFISDSLAEWRQGALHESVNLFVHFPFGDVSVVLSVFSLSEEA